MRQLSDPKYSHLHEDLHVEVTTFAPPAEAYSRMSHAISELKPFLVPVSDFTPSNIEDDDRRRRRHQGLRRHGIGSWTLCQFVGSLMGFFVYIHSAQFSPAGSPSPHSASSRRSQARSILPSFSFSRALLLRTSSQAFAHFPFYQYPSYIRRDLSMGLRPAFVAAVSRV